MLATSSTWSRATSQAIGTLAGARWNRYAASHEFAPASSLLFTPLAAATPDDGGAIGGSRSSPDGPDADGWLATHTPCRILISRAPRSHTLVFCSPQLRLGTGRPTEPSSQSARHREAQSAAWLSRQRHRGFEMDWASGHSSAESPGDAMTASTWQLDTETLGDRIISQHCCPKLPNY